MEMHPMNAKQKIAWITLLEGIHEVYDVVMKCSLCLSVFLCKVLEDHSNHFSCCCIHSLVTISHILSHSGEESWIEKNRIYKWSSIPLDMLFMTRSVSNTAGASFVMNFHKYLKVNLFPKITTGFIFLVIFKNFTTFLVIFKSNTC